MKRALLVILTGLLALSFLADFAMPAEKAKQAETLPGVSVDHKIVGSVPPEPTDRETDPTTFRVGNTDVHISGYVQVDVTAGRLGSPRH